MRYLLAQQAPSGRWKAGIAAAAPAGAHHVSFDPDNAEITSTVIVSKAVSRVRDAIWQLELAANATNADKVAMLAGQELARAALNSDGTAKSFATAIPNDVSGDASLQSLKYELGIAANSSNIGNTVLHIVACKLAWLSALWLLLRYGGSSPRTLGNFANDSISGGTVIALHAEDTTRTRHLRGALAKHLDDHNQRQLLLLLGRPSAGVKAALRALDPKGQLGEIDVRRPMNVRALLRTIPQTIARLANGVSATGAVPFPIPMRERIAMAYRMIQGTAQAQWWQSAVGPSAVGPSAASQSPATALFGHTGTADTSILELAMQSCGAQTIHVVHGTNVGWPFAGLSDAAIFQTSADAQLGATLPAYQRCTYIPATCPPLRAGLGSGDGRWAVLTSYTHLSHPAYHQNGADADIALIQMAAQAAARMGQPPEKILWRPHPHIEVVATAERARLLAAVKAAGFTRWPDSLPYDALGSFSAVMTSPSTVLTDALRVGQPAIVVSLTPLQDDLIYNRPNLLVRDLDGLLSALQGIADPAGASDRLRMAWDAIEPGGPLTIEAILAAACCS